MKDCTSAKTLATVTTLRISLTAISAQAATPCRFMMLQDGPGSRAMSEAEATLDELASARVTIAGARRKRELQGAQSDLGDVYHECKRRRVVAISPMREAARTSWKHGPTRICTSPAQDEDRVILRYSLLKSKCPRNLCSAVRTWNAHNNSQLTCNESSCHS